MGKRATVRWTGRQHHGIAAVAQVIDLDRRLVARGFRPRYGNRIGMPPISEHCSGHSFRLLRPIAGNGCHPLRRVTDFDMSHCIAGGVI